MATLYLDISSDKVYLSCDGEEFFLERNGIENELGKVLVQRRKKFSFSKAFILNWPWGFTNLRVGSLCVNLLNALTGDAVDCYSVSKVEVYQYAYDHGKLPKMGVIYIGQKRNIWLWDFEKQEKVEQMNFDALRERMESNRVSNQLFLDVVYDQAYYPAFLHGMQMVDYHLPQQWIERYVEEKGVKPTKAIEANYMIDPKIG